MGDTVRLFQPSEDGPKIKRPARGGRVYQYRPNVAEVAERYLAYTRQHGVHSERTHRDVARSLELFAAKYGGLRAEAMLAYQLVDWVDEHPEWKAPWTRRTHMSAVRAAFKWAADQGRIPNDPFRGVKLPVGERSPEMTDDVLAKVCRAANKPLENGIRFLRLTGARVGELCGAKWGGMDLARGVWTVREHKTRKKTKKPKYIALVPEAVDLLRGLLDVPDPPGPDEHVFRNTQGRAWTPKSFHLAMVRVKVKLKIEGPVSPHAIRHRYGSAWVAAGGSVSLLAAQLGHTSSQTTERYYVDLSGQFEAIREQAKLAAPKF